MDISSLLPMVCSRMNSLPDGGCPSVHCTRTNYLPPMVVVLYFQDELPNSGCPSVHCTRTLPAPISGCPSVPGQTPNGGCPSVHCTRTNSLPPLVVVLVYQDEFFALRWLSHIIGENLTHVCVCLLRPTVSHFEVLLCLYASCVNSKLLED